MKKLALAAAYAPPAPSPPSRLLPKPDLRTMCPTLAAGSQFGYLYTYEIDATNRIEYNLPTEAF